jgi:hypothetical protein
MIPSFWLGHGELEWLSWRGRWIHPPVVGHGIRQLADGGSIPPGYYEFLKQVAYIFCFTPFTRLRSGHNTGCSRVVSKMIIPLNNHGFFFKPEAA